jgi:hypothetical protein
LSTLKEANDPCTSETVYINTTQDQVAEIAIACNFLDWRFFPLFIRLRACFRFLCPEIMTSETTRHETYQKDSYNFSFGMIGGRANNCNSHGHGKPSKPSRKRRKHYSVEGGTGHSNHDDDDDHGSNNHHVQSQPPQQQGVSLQTAPGGYAYPYQRPPPPYPNQLAVGGGGYHGHYNVVPAGYPYPAGSFVPPQGTSYCEFSLLSVVSIQTNGD